MAALDDVLPALRCPVCRGRLSRDALSPDAPVRCPDGHAYDVAKQGYLNLVGPRARHPGDDAPMVAARARFLAAGHYAPLSEALAATARPGLVLDLAGGTGHHLAAVLDAQPTAGGLVLDTSTAALRRAARAHPRMAAVGADAWSPLPVDDGVACTVLSVFGPRDPAEIARVLSPDGVAVVAGPRPDHLHELRDALPLLGISPDRTDRLDAAFAAFTRAGRATVRFAMTLDQQAVADLVGMGPSARHLTDLAERVSRLPPQVVVTAAVEVVTYVVNAA